jgi:acetolactate synthase I/II/III large subunit
MARLTGGQIVAQALKQYGVPYVTAIPGHGIWSALDAFLEPGSQIPVIQVFHEQSAVHLADGFYRTTGHPLAAFTSIGPGATNTVIGLATAYADSTAVLLITGGPATHMRGHGVMQELERATPNDFPKVTEAVTKRHFVVSRVDELPFVMHRAFSAMLTGRPGPVHVEIPMDVQAESTEVSVHDLSTRLPVGRSYPDSRAIDQAGALLAESFRPVIVLGGGAVSADAADAVLSLAEAWRAPVVTTWNGKGGFAEDHALFAGSVGQTGTPCGNFFAARADVVVSVGCRFTDWSASSWRRGSSFSIPPSRLVQIDIDPQEIGKNYPAAVGIVSDARPAVEALAGYLSGRAFDRGAYLEELRQHKEAWETLLSTRRDSDEVPMTSQRPLAVLRRLLPRDGIVVAGSGNTQGAVKQTFPVYMPRTHLTSGSFSAMGWAVPAAIGAKLGAPDRAVVCVLGDGDFLQTMQEMAVCVANDISVVFLVQNNQGYMSIRGGQRKQTSRHIASEFNCPDGSPYSPEFAAIARHFGLNSWRVDDPGELEATLGKALSSGGPALVEVITARDAAGPWVSGWWDFPVPAYVADDRQEEYWVARNEEQHR